MNHQSICKKCSKPMLKKNTSATECQTCFNDRMEKLDKAAKMHTGQHKNCKTCDILKKFRKEYLGQ